MITTYFINTSGEWALRYIRQERKASHLVTCSPRGRQIPTAKISETFGPCMKSGFQKFMQLKLPLKVWGSSFGYCRREDCLRDPELSRQPAICRKGEPVNLRESSYLGLPGIFRDMVLATRQLLLSGETVLYNNIVC
jgi:hypothetical protein